MNVNILYDSFQGEVNRFGIGSPALFLRLQGCPIRCYKRTFGKLCDTPESLSKPISETKINSIFVGVEKLSEKTGIKVITLTGGDPLWNPEAELVELFTGLSERGFFTSVETSGTISWLPYANLSNNISWVVDYKLKSAGVKNATVLFSDEAHLESLKETDHIKFVVYGEDDYEEMKSAVERIFPKTKAKIAVGSYWGGEFSTIDLYKKLSSDGLFDKVTLNMQVHKMAVSSNYSVKIPIKL